MAGCACKRMSALLRRLGARHAAAMHAKLGAQWSMQDWLVHFREEEDLIFPEMYRLCRTEPRHRHLCGVVDRLLAEHQMFRQQIAEGRLDKAALERHAQLEDKYVLELEPYFQPIKQESKKAPLRSRLFSTRPNYLTPRRGQSF